ncbi:MAG: ThuA domain-containing protein [Akkermansiaceae bacterium]|nr:ThuA domain-containing protein [Akkermansiaceae bacterium]
MILRIACIAVFSALGLSFAAAETHRLEVLFLGDNGHHNPLERYRVLKRALGPEGFNLTYIEDLSEVTRETLNQYDALVVYANHEKEVVPEAILPWVRDGGALVALHSACGNFHPSKDWFNLIGGRFKTHGGAEFIPTTIDKDHPITKDLPELKSWDETYEHMDLTADRHILQMRPPINKGETKPEPWTWTRNEAKGRVFYTASGHDERCWEQQAYQTLVKRAILWTIGEKKASKFAQINLPKLETEIPQIPNRTHPDIPMMELQKPLSPADSAAHTQVPVGTKLVLFAAEPMVINPIAIDWDAKGRAWVIESFGYPNDVPNEPGTGQDKIKILEDTDGDGKADKMTVFAEGLRHCTTSVFVKNGVVITDAKDIVYLGDEDGDGKCDTRRVLATGLGINDTHASTSNFLYGLDHWIYATVGYSGVNIDLNGKKHKFGQGVFRFRPDLYDLEFLQDTTNNTWGLGFTEMGDVLGSTANNNPSWMISIPNAAYLGSGIDQPKTPRLDTSLPATDFKIGTSTYQKTQLFTNSDDVTQVDQIGRYTAAAGHHFYNDTVMKKTFTARNAFICEPTGHLVAVGDVVAAGALKQTILRGNNAFASSDAWASPVAARVGPDGALWIADWYSPIIQHNVVFRYYNPARSYDQPHSPYQAGKKVGPGKGNAYETPLRDSKYGRIWRIVPSKDPLRKAPDIDPSKIDSLVTNLASPSQWIRLQAQRLLIEHGGDSAISQLVKTVQAEEPVGSSGLPLAAIHAIWTLQGLSASPNPTAKSALTNALASSKPLIRRHAMLALGATDPAVVAALPAMITDTQDLREQLIALTTAALTLPNEAISSALWKTACKQDLLETTSKDAMRLAMRRQGLTLFSADFSRFSADAPTAWSGQEIIAIITRIAASSERQKLVEFAATAPAGLRAHIDQILRAAPVINRVPVDVPQAFFAGRDAYMKACIECHQADGRGVPDTFPPLTGSPWVKGDPDIMTLILLGGLTGPVEINGLHFNGVMPGHSHLTDAELAQIASFVRFAFGDKREEPITAEQVKALRPAVEKRKFVPWTVKDLNDLYQ